MRIRFELQSESIRNSRVGRSPLIGIKRLRVGTDGRGVTTLVAFNGCPLRCKYCLNPQCWGTIVPEKMKSADEVMAILRKDELYFLATGGGITFGGGEPLSHPVFIKELLELGAKSWHITAETSLNVPQEHLVMLLSYIDEYVVDVKDMDTHTYKAYTGRDNELVMSNLRWLIQQGKANNILCRIPLIPKFNTRETQQVSLRELKKMGIHRFDTFTYKTNINKII